MFFRRCLTLTLAALACASANAADSFAVPNNAAGVLARFCNDCHSGKSAEGNVQLDLLSQLGIAERLEVLNKAQEQLFFQRMPPEDAENRVVKVGFEWVRLGPMGTGWAKVIRGKRGSAATSTTRSELPCSPGVCSARLSSCNPSRGKRTSTSAR